MSVYPYTANQNCSRRQFGLFFFYLPGITSPDISYESDDSHEMSKLIFSENRKNKLRLSSTNFTWHSMGEMCSHQNAFPHSLFCPGFTSK